jgi:hypothetical protein
MSLQVLKDGDDISFWDGREFEAFRPPFSELVVDLHVKHVRRRWGFGESISDVDAESDVVESRDESPSEPMGWLFHACSVGFSYGNDFTISGATVACAAGFFDVL